MQFFGIGLHILIALFFAIHAVRSGQPIYWLFILFSFPLLGSLAYFLVVFLPNSRIERSAINALASATRALDPTRELREARAAFEYTPTAQNQMRLKPRSAGYFYVEHLLLASSNDRNGSYCDRWQRCS